MPEKNLSEEEVKKQFAAVYERAQKLGVLDISFSKTSPSPNVVECYNRTLDVIEKHKSTLYRNAGETEV